MSENGLKKTAISFLSEGFFWLAVVLAYFKTAELMSLFAPKQMLGFTGISTWYGLAAALLVEGVFVVMKYKLQFSEAPAARLWATVIVVGTAAVSFAAQGLDSAYITGKITELPAEVRGAFAILVPALPVIVMVVLAVAEAAERTPEDGGGNSNGSGKSSAKGRKKASPTRWEDLTMAEAVSLKGKSTAQIKATYPGISERSAYNWGLWAKDPKRLADKAEGSE